MKNKNWLSKPVNENIPGKKMNYSTLLISLKIQIYYCYNKDAMRKNPCHFKYNRSNH